MPGTASSDEAWEAAARLLADPATHGGAAPEIIETHTARIYLAGKRAWKLRRPVNHGWLDYSTPALRHAAAEREVERNGPNAPGLYLGLAGIEGGRLSEPGAPLGKGAEPVVAMRRFPAGDLFAEMAGNDRLDRALMHRTGLAIAAMHRRVPALECGPRLPELVSGEANALTRLAPVLGADRTEALSAALQAAEATGAPGLARRRARRCHGDLHLGNIVLWQGEPAPFDCIDFNDDFAVIDPLYDIAFLMMDLALRDREDLATAALTAWTEGMCRAPGAEEETAFGGLSLLPLYTACRAAIRAKVAGLRAEQGDKSAAAEGRRYLDLGLRILAPRPAPVLIAVGGLSGSGKSTLARGIAERTGALVLRSDAIRKGIAGVAEDEALPSSAYSPESSAEVYAAMRARAAQVLAAGRTALLDAVHLRAEERAAAEALAAAAGAAFHGIWLDLPPETLKERVAARRGDASDATPAVVARQMTTETGAIGWTRIGGQDAGAALDEALGLLPGGIADEPPPL